MNSSTLGLHLELIKVSTRAVASGHTCEAIALAMSAYADALVNLLLALPVRAWARELPGERERAASF